MITVALIEDNRMLRDGMTRRLNEEPDLRVVVSDPVGDLTRMREASPQVILLDGGLRKASSLRLSETVREQLPSARVIVTDLPPVHEEVIEFVNAGVAGFVLQDATSEELVRTIRSVAEGRTVLPAQMTSTLFSQITQGAAARERREAAVESRLTAREREVMRLIRDGLSNKAIGQELGISPLTVKSHVRNIMDKLGLRSRLQIATYRGRRRGRGASRPPG